MDEEDGAADSGEGGGEDDQSEELHDLGMDMFFWRKDEPPKLGNRWDWHTYRRNKMRAEAAEARARVTSARAAERADRLLRGLRGLRDGCLALAGRGSCASHESAGAGTGAPVDDGGTASGSAGRCLVPLGSSGGLQGSVQGVLGALGEWCGGAWERGGGGAGGVDVFWGRVCDECEVMGWVLPADGASLVEAQA